MNLTRGFPNTGSVVKRVVTRQNSPSCLPLKMATREPRSVATETLHPVYSNAWSGTNLRPLPDSGGEGGGGRGEGLACAKPLKPVKKNRFEGKENRLTN